MAKDKDLNDLLYDIKRIAEHRVELTDEKIEKIYNQLMSDLRLFLSEAYEKYADTEGRLYMSYLDQNRAKASFLQQIADNVDNLAPELRKTMEDMVDEVYEVCYKGMVESLKKANTRTEIAELIRGIDVDENALNSAINNNISKLTLPAVMENNRAWIIYEIQRELVTGLINGDRYEKMTNRIKDRVGVGETKAKRIVRTEAHRNVESGFMDCAENIQSSLDGSGLIYAATWRTMGDERVRPQQRRKTKRGWKTYWSKNGANHMKMEGKTVKAGDKFDLGGGVKAKAPSMSGDAKNDVNCRCFLEYNLMTEEEFAKATGKDGKGLKYIKTDDKLTSKSADGRNTTSRFKDFDELKTYYSESFDVIIDDKVKDLNLESISESLKGVESVLKSFPASHSWKSVLSESFDGTMGTNFYGEMGFNTSRYLTREAALKTVRNPIIKETSTHLHPQNFNLQGAGAHEAGHLLEKSIVDKKFDGAKTAWEDGEAASYVVDKAIKKISKSGIYKEMSKEEMRLTISHYAYKDVSECLAEGVCDVFLNGDKAAELSRAIWEVLKEEIK